MKKVVSIVIPVYNAGKYIKRCIDSIIGQTYNDWEVIAVNDGSTDDSLTILNQYAGDDRITVIDIPNGGVVNARKTALSYANGIYLTFVDADDYLPPVSLQLMVDRLVSTDSDLVVGGYTLLWEKDRREKEVNNKKEFNTVGDCIKYCIKNGETFLPVKLYKTDIFRASVNIPHDVTFMEDTIGVLQYLSVCKRVTSVDSSIYVYFKNTGSASMSTNPRKLLSMIKVSEFLMHYEPFEPGAHKIVWEKAGDLLYYIIGQLNYIPESREKVRQQIQCYIKNKGKLIGFRDTLLALYLSLPSTAIAIQRILNSFGIFKSMIKRKIWKMIH